uniref:FK506-binding protein n=1 Tax=Fagus sylvatica TaxID=28930 RepID=A0A2N9J201_FAGSY
MLGRPLLCDRCDGATVGSVRAERSVRRCDGVARSGSENLNQTPCPPSPTPPTSITSSSKPLWVASKSALPTNPFHSQSLEDLLFEAANLSDDDNDDDDENDENNSSKTQLAKEESKLEKEIVRVILSGKTDSLKPNSGQAVTIGEHHICVGFHEETGSDYRVWEWHGHIMLFDEENGYTPEYIYGNYFERLLVKSRGVEEEKEEEQEQEQEEKEEKVSNLGLRELIDAGDSNGARILHRNVNAGSPRFI